MENNLEDIINEKASLIVNQSKEIDNSFNIEPPKFVFKQDETKGYDEQAKEFVGALATQQAVKDEKLVEDVTTKKKEEIIDYVESNLNEQKAKTKDASKKLQDANYGVNSGVASYAGIKRALPLKMQNILFGILAFFQTILLIVCGIPTSIINIIADCVNSIVEKLSAIAKSARWLMYTLLIISAIVLAGYVIVCLLKRFNLIN